MSTIKRKRVFNTLPGNGTEGQHGCRRLSTWKLTPIALALASLASISAPAYAFQFKTGNPDLQIRWDNTVKYLLSVRTQEISQKVVGDGSTASILGDDADLGWERGDIINNRVDLLSEMDVIWKGNFGFRISAAGWYDHAYRDGTNHPGYNEYLEQSQPYYGDTWGSTEVAPGQLSDDAQFLAYKGAELLDAFIFGSWDIGESMAFSFRAGRHSLFWGNTLFLNGAINGIGGSMSSVDAGKGRAVPGTSAKELFRPTNKLSASFQFSQNLSVVGYYSFEFEEYRLEGNGTYRSSAEGLTPDTSQFATLTPGRIDPQTLELVGNPRTGFSKTNDKTPGAGEWGMGVNYYFEDSGWDLGLYFLNYNDKLPQGLNGAMDLSQFAANQGLNKLVANWPDFNNGVPANPVDEYNDAGYPAIGIGNFNWVYKEDNKLLGLSLSNELWGISWGSDMVYRKDVPLNTNLNAQLQHVTNIPDDLPPATSAGLEAALTANGFAYDNWDYYGKDSGNYPGAVGDSWHFVLNGIGVLTPTGLWDGGSWSFEATAASMIRVTENEELINESLIAGQVSSVLRVAMTPAWFQVLPRTDLRLRLVASYGLMGDAAPIAFGGSRDRGAASIALNATYNQVWLYDLRYGQSYGKRGGLGSNTMDRGNLNFTIKRTF